MPMSLATPARSRRRGPATRNSTLIYSFEFIGEYVLPLRVAMIFAAFLLGDLRSKKIDILCPVPDIGREITRSKIADPPIAGPLLQPDVGDFTTYLGRTDAGVSSWPSAAEPRRVPLMVNASAIPNARPEPQPVRRVLGLANGLGWRSSSVGITHSRT